MLQVLTQPFPDLLDLLGLFIELRAVLFQIMQFLIGELPAVHELFANGRNPLRRSIL